MSQPTLPTPAAPGTTITARMLGIAALLGLVASAAGSLFIGLIDNLQEYLFHGLPGSLGWTAAPWWWMSLILLGAAAVVALAQRLPGRTGHGPLDGFHFDTPLRVAPSVLLAAFASLVGGIALGPEAPLIVVGTTIGALAARGAQPQARQAAMLLGGVAAIGAVFGNPFVTGFMLLEFAAIGVLPSVLLVPSFVALASGYLTEIGVASIPGFGLHPLSVPGLPQYTSIAAADLPAGLVVAAVAAVVAITAREGGIRVRAVANQRPVATLLAAAAVTALALTVAVEGFGIAPNQVLFSGNTGMPGLIAQTSVVTVLVIVVAKAVAYAVALGSGFRGGPIFPATFLGVAVAVLASLLFTGIALTPLAAAGIAASAAAMTRLPATSALLGALLVAGTGPAVAPFAIFGAVAGLLVAAAADRLLGRTAAEATRT